MASDTRPLPPDDRPVRLQGAPVDYFPLVPPEARRGHVRRITVVGEEILGRPCQPVTTFATPELSALIDDLFATQYVSEGAGLAANQVDVALRVFVWDCTDESGTRHVGHIVNPVLDSTASEGHGLIEQPEGCLSVPGAAATLPRPDHVVVRGHDKEGRGLAIEGRGYFARCLLHETDHLDGRLYLDRLAPRQRRAALREMEDLQDAVFARRRERAARFAGGSVPGT